MAFRLTKPCWNSLGISTGQTWTHSPQLVHFSGSTYRGSLFTVTLKSPASPSTFSISAESNISTLGYPPSPNRRQPLSLGEIIHIRQSWVGNIVSNWDITPPMPGFLSTRYTLNPESAKSIEAWMPPIPPPMTSTDPIFLSFLVDKLFILLSPG